MTSSRTWPGSPPRRPSGASLVVYHSAVLAYVELPKRRAFADAVRDLGAVWLSNEGSESSLALPLTQARRASFSSEMAKRCWLALTPTGPGWSGSPDPPGPAAVVAAKRAEPDEHITVDRLGLMMVEGDLLRERSVRP